MKKVLKAQEFKLINAEGQEKASLWLNGSGDPSLIFFNKEGQARLVMGNDREGNPSFSMLGSDNNAQGITISVKNDSSVDLRLGEFNGRLRIISSNDRGTTENLVTVEGDRVSEIKLEL